MASMKKFEVIRRDKSQPEVLFRNGEKRHMMNSRDTKSTAHLTGVNSQAHGSKTQLHHHQSNKSGQALNNTVMIQGGSVNANTIQS